MTQIIPLTAVLGSTNTGLTIGYRVLNVIRTVYSAFTTTNVAETAIAGTYAVTGGITVPTAGCYVIVGTAVVDKAEMAVDGTDTDTAGTTEILTRLPDATAGSIGGLPTVDAANMVAGAIALGAQAKLDVTAAVPTAIDNAAQVRTNLAVELGRIDVATSTRLASGTVAADVTAILIDTGTTIPAALAILGVAPAFLGAGAVSTPITITVGGVVKDGVEVWVTTDALGTAVVASGTTDALGVVTFMLDSGSYFVFKQCSGVNFTNPQTLSVV